MKKTSKTRYGKRLALLILGMAIGAFLFGLWFGGDLYHYENSVDSAHLPEVDAIVCLAGGRGRIAAAGDLWAQYWKSAQQADVGALKVPYLYLSGTGHQVNWVEVSRQLKRDILQIIRPENVVIENESSNTDANARWLGKYAQKMGWKKILLFTSTYHMKRAQFIFEHVLREMDIPLEIETLSYHQEPFDQDQWRASFQGIRVTLVEYLKWIYYQSVWKAL